MRGFDYLPRLVAEPVVLRPRDDVRSGEGTLRLTSSPYDPVGEVPVGELVTCAYGKFDNTMLPGKIVGRVWNPLAFAKHAQARFLQGRCSAREAGLYGRPQQLMTLVREES